MSTANAAMRSAPRPPTSLGLLGKLPRELRDEIYGYVIPPTSSDELSQPPEVRNGDVKSGCYLRAVVTHTRPYLRAITHTRPFMLTNTQFRRECLEVCLRISEIIASPDVSVYRLLRQLQPYVDVKSHVWRLGMPIRLDLLSFTFGQYNHVDQLQQWIRGQARLPIYFKSLAYYCVEGKIPAKRLFLLLNFTSGPTADFFVGQGVRSVWNIVRMPEIPECKTKLWICDRGACIAELNRAVKVIKGTLEQDLRKMISNLNEQKLSPSEHSYHHGLVMDGMSKLLEVIDDWQAHLLSVIEAILEYWETASQFWTGNKRAADEADSLDSTPFRPSKRARHV